MVRKLWAQAAAKAREVAAAGGSAPELPPFPRHYTCKEEPSIATSFLVGMDEVARIVHWVSDSRQRCACCPAVSPQPMLGSLQCFLHKHIPLQRRVEGCLQANFVSSATTVRACCRYRLRSKAMSGIAVMSHAAVLGLQAPAEKVLRLCLARAEAVLC